LETNKGEVVEGGRTDVVEEDDDVVVDGDEKEVEVVEVDGIEDVVDGGDDNDKDEVIDDEVRGKV
jgi:hypothetical protein